jgi:penicillin-insensitive murein endopeptidase
MSRPLAALTALSLAALSGCAGSLGEGLHSRSPWSPTAPTAPPPASYAPSLAPPPTPEVAAVPSSNPADEEVAALDDDAALEGEGIALPSAAPANSPALALSDAELERRFHHDPASLGPASVGPASAGALVNGVQMPHSDRWQLNDPGCAYGTQETVDALTRSIERVNQRFPGTPPIMIGHLSARNGGHLSPHRSHQSGRDADVGYYYKGGTRPFIHATAENLDLPRTWALVKAALTETTVEMILIDQAVQRVLADYAAASGEPPAFLDEVFQVRGKNARAPIRHVKGHDNHIHFRFHNPIAEAMGRRVARFVVLPRPRDLPTHGARVAVEKVDAARSAPVYAQIRARSGDTLVILARRYGATVEEIQRANNLRGNAIRAGMVYRIPQKQGAAPAAQVKAPPARGPAKAPARVAQRKPPRKPALHTPPAKPKASADP